MFSRRAGDRMNCIKKIPVIACIVFAAMSFAGAQSYSSNYYGMYDDDWAWFDSMAKTLDAVSAIENNYISGNYEAIPTDPDLLRAYKEFDKQSSKILEDSRKRTEKIINNLNKILDDADKGKYSGSSYYSTPSYDIDKILDDAYKGKYSGSSYYSSPSYSSVPSYGYGTGSYSNSSSSSGYQELWMQKKRDAKNDAAYWESQAEQAYASGNMDSYRWARQHKADAEKAANQYDNYLHSR